MVLYIIHTRVKKVGKFDGPLHHIADLSCSRFGFSRLSDCKCVEMLKIILPKIRDFNVKEWQGGMTPLNLCLSRLERYNKVGESDVMCLKEKIKILAPLTDLNITDKRRMSAFDYAFHDNEIREIFVQLQLMN